MTKEEKIKKYLAEPIKKGDKVYVRGLGSQNKNAFNTSTEVLGVEEDFILYKQYSSITKAHLNDVKKVTYDIGVNPINESLWRKVQNINFALDSILLKLGLDGYKKDKYKTNKGFQIKICNFNPFTEIKGEKKFYQRPFVWTLEEMQSLIHSIYNRVDCGKIIIRSRSWEWLHERELEEECYWYDVVDGKQRLTAIKKFLNNEFQDRFGNFYKDLSDNAQNAVTNHQLFSYAELGESVEDEDVLKQFLSINFSGVPQSKEHIEYVESLLKS